MAGTIQGLNTVAGRVLLALIFTMSALGNKIPKFSEVAQMMEGQGVPAPQLMLVGAILFLVAGSLSVMLGFRARIGAALLLIFLVLATYYFHDFWTWPEEAMWVLSTDENVKIPVQQIEMISFMKNAALMGAMLLIIANGSGPMSLDSILRRASQVPSGNETWQFDGSAVADPPANPTGAIVSNAGEAVLGGK